MKIWIWISLCVFIGLGISPDCTAESSADTYTVRVAILNQVPHVNLEIKGGYVLKSTQNGTEVDTGRRLSSISVSADPLGIRFGEHLYPYKEITIVPENDATILVQNRRFRGEMRIVLKDKQLLVINDIELEQYVKGVLYHEVSHRWPLEAIKAQAVATRTYVLYTRTYRKNNEFDVTNDIYSQVYGGRNSERYRTNLAVSRTEGQILMYKGKVIPAYFHATCAGHTEDASELWNIDLPPLKGRPCPYCTHSPHYEWKKNFQLKPIQESLNKNGFHLGLIKEVRVSERNESGRIRQLEILTRDGKSVKVSGKIFRDAVGPNAVRSNNYEPIMQGYYMDLVGHGWGHGVGMCQWGAFGMSRLRHDYEDILEFYYPGTELAPYTKIKKDLKVIKGSSS